MKGHKWPPASATGKWEGEVFQVDPQSPLLLVGDTIASAQQQPNSSRIAEWVAAGTPGGVALAELYTNIGYDTVNLP